MSGAAEIIRRARTRAGISQAELARRLDTKQPVVARWERGRQSPDFDVVTRAVAACGFDLEPTMAIRDPQTDAQLRRWLAMSPDERLALNQELIDTERWTRSAKTVRRLREP